MGGREGGGEGGEIVETIIAENFPNVMKTVIPQIKGAPQNKVQEL